MAVRQELDCHPQVIRFVESSAKHYNKLLSRVPTARFATSEVKSYALVNSPLEYLALMGFFSEYDHLEHEFETQKISIARGLSKLHRDELNYLSARYECGGDIFISWSSREKVHISGVKDKLRGKLVYLKWLVHYETVNRSFTPDTYRILLTGGVFNDLREQFGDKLHIGQIDENNEIMLIGGKKEITEASAFLTRKTNGIQRLRLNDLLLDWKKLEFLRKCLQGVSIAERNVIDTFERTLANVSVAFRMDGEDVVISSNREALLFSTTMRFNTMICSVKLPRQIDPEIFRLEEWKEMRTRTLEKFAVMPIDEEGEISLIGLNQSILLCIDEIEGFGMEVVATLTPAAVRLFRGQGEQFINNFPTANIHINVKDSGEVVLRGKKTWFAHVKDIFLRKHEQVITKECYLKTSYADFLKSNEGQRVVKEFEENHECSIFIPKSPIESRNEDPQTLESYDPTVLCSCTVKTAAGSEVLIQLYSRRKITKHKCDVLIHPFYQRSDFSNEISGSILVEAGLLIQYELQRHLSLGGFKPVQTSAGNIQSCKHIIHCCLPSRKNVPNAEEDLSRAMLSIFRAADNTDANVVAVPVGVGGLHFIGKSIVKALTDAIPLSLNRVDIVGVASSPAVLMEEFSSEIIENVSTTKTSKPKVETGRKTIILKSPFSERLTPNRGMFDMISPDKWVSEVEQRLQKAYTNGNTAVEIHVPPHANPVYTARLTKRSLEDFKELHPSIFQLTMSENDPETSLAYESVFSGAERLYEGRRTDVMLGPVKLSVKIGDITDETADAIVNLRHEDQEDYLSKRIQQKAAYVTTLYSGRFVTVTTGGRLRCKKIIQAFVPQVAFWNFEEALTDATMEILTTANRHRLSTISIAPNFADVPFEGFWILGNYNMPI